MTASTFTPRSAGDGAPPPRPDFSNWGRWGAADEAGAANQITPERLLAALAMPTEGRVVPLGQVIGDRKAPRTGGVAQHFMQNDAGDYLAGATAPQGFKAAADHIGMNVHGASTHLDALGHVWYDDSLFNGFPQETVRSSGLKRLGIDKAPPFLTRGVLVDLPRHQGVEHLAPGHEITAAEIEDCCAAEGLEIRAGDAVLVRTGWINTWDSTEVAYGGDRPGIGLDASVFLAERDIALVGADNSGVEVIPWAPGTCCPVHQFLIRDCGIYLLEFLDLEELSAQGRGEFLFVAVPLRIRGGTGSPISPVAVL